MREGGMLVLNRAQLVMELRGAGGDAFLTTGQYQEPTSRRPLKSAMVRIAYLILAPPISSWCAFVWARVFVGRGRTRISPRVVGGPLALHA